MGYTLRTVVDMSPTFTDKGFLQTGVFLAMFLPDLVWGKLTELPKGLTKVAQVRFIFKHDTILCCWAEPRSAIPFYSTDRNSMEVPNSTHYGCCYIQISNSKTLCWLLHISLLTLGHILVATYKFLTLDRFACCYKSVPVSRTVCLLPHTSS